MRDVEQMREKYQLQLEGRQIAALALGALVLLSCVFALGLGLGRRLSKEPQPQADLDNLDAQAAPAPKSVPIPVPPPAPARVAEAPPPPVQQASAVDPKDAVVVAPAKKEPLVVPAPPRTMQTAAVVLTPPPKDLSAYTVQIGASPDRAEASRLESRARGAGLKPYVVEADLGAKGTWYRVRVGSFENKDSANQFRRDVERELRAAAVVMPTK